MDGRIFTKDIHELNKDKEYGHLILKNKRYKLKLNLHKVLYVCEDSEEDSKQYASKKTEGNNHSNHEIPDIMERNSRMRIIDIYFPTTVCNSRIYS